MPPPVEGPPPLENTEDVSPLPLPLPNIPVGGRLVHFAQNWAKLTDDKWVLSLIKRGYKIPFRERPLLYQDPVFFHQPLSQQLEEEVANLLKKGAVEEIIPECPGFYSRIFLVPKKNGKLCAQSLCSCSELQNGDTEKSEKCHQPQRLGIFLGPDGCLFAYSDTLSVTQIPQVHVERSSVPVQGTSIRPLDQPFRFHSSYVRHSDVSKKKGNNSSSLSRRLVISKPKSSNTTGTQTIYPVSDQFSRSDYQLREIRPSSSSSVHIHRDGISDSLQYCQSPSVKGPEIIGNSKSFLTENLGISQSFPVSFGTTECSSGLCSTGTVTSPATTNVTAQSVEASEISVEPPSWYINENSTSPQMVATG